MESTPAQHDPHQEKVLILDFGSQYTQLIARRVRELKVYCEIHPYIMPLEQHPEFAPQGHHPVGRPPERLRPGRPQPSTRSLFSLGVPVLGICYGIQLLNHLLGGEVAPAESREYGHKTFTISNFDDLFYGLNARRAGLDEPRRPGGAAWRRGSRSSAAATPAPPGLSVTSPGGSTGCSSIPKCTTRPGARRSSATFCSASASLKPLWTMASFIETTTESIRQQVGDGQVICALSGGVDSSVTAMLVHRAIGDRLTCVFVNNGLLRKREAEEVFHLFREHHHLNLVYVDATVDFLCQLEGVIDPEEKRRRIGHEFIRIFAAEAKKLGGVKYLAQGTLYPDVIESVSFKGPSATIKTHHNVGGLPDDHALEAAGAPAGAVQGRGAGSGQGTGPAGQPGLAPPLSRARGWPSASWAKSPPSNWISSGRPTPSSWKRCWPANSTARSGRPLRCSCPSAPWG